MNSDKLKAIFTSIVPPTIDADAEWQIIGEKYSNTGRHYHTLQHLNDMYTELEQYYAGIVPVTTILALVYHDFEYNVLRSDNEKQSALYAASRLRIWGQHKDVVDKVTRMIECTQQHTGDSDNSELLFFLDADMAILGSNTETYLAYTEAVRKEFAIYPDFMYKKGRRDFLKRTLSNQNIFLTNYFNNKYSIQARINIQKELNSLL